MTETWPWLVLAGLGAFHGVNPAMGWLFAVALGLHRRSRAAVLWALPAIAAGHALSVAAVAFAVVAGGAVIGGRWLYAVAGVLLVGWAVYHRVYGHRHRVRVGLKTGQAGLVFWSFLMATAHGAGLMILPALIPLCLAGSTRPEIAGMGPAATAASAVAVHTIAMLAVTGVVAVVVHRWLGLAVLRYAWLNLDLLWTVALAATGAVLLALALAEAGGAPGGVT